VRLAKLYILTIFIGKAYAQKLPTRPYWSYNTTLSSSFFLSDLGGKNGNGTNDFQDIDPNKTRFALGGSINYNLPVGFSTGIDLNWVRLAGDDSETQSGRTPRMISIRTDLLESNLTFKYTLPKRTGSANGLYFFVGAGAAYYQPKAEWNGTWYNLRELGTEGQLLDPTKNIYTKITPVLPFGFGKKFYFYNGVSLAADFNFRKSYTDYIDDVSTVYFDNNLILNTNGSIAAHFANPSSNPKAGVTGNKRGNPNRMDNYFLVGCRLEVPIRNNYRRRKRSNLFDAFGIHWIDENGRLRN